MATTRFTQKQVGEQQVYIIRQRDDLPLVLFECVAFFIDDYFDPAERPTRLHAYVWAPDFDAALDFSGDHFSRRVQPCQSSELVGPAGAERLPDLRACAVRYARRATNNSQSWQQGGAGSIATTTKELNLGAHAGACARHAPARTSTNEARPVGVCLSG